MGKELQDRALGMNEVVELLNKKGWVVMPGKSTRGIKLKDRDVAKAEVGMDWLTITTGSRLVVLGNPKAFRSNGHTLFVRGEIVRSALDGSNGTALRFGVIRLVHAKAYELQRQRRLEQRWIPEIDTVRWHERRLAADSERLERIDVEYYLKREDGRLPVSETLSADQLADVFSGGGWQVRRGRLWKHLSRGVMLSATAARSGHEVTVTMDDGVGYTIPAHHVNRPAPWCISIFATTFEQQKLPKKMDGGVRRVPVYTVVLQLKNSSIWAEHHPETMEKFRKLREDSASQRAAQRANLSTVAR